MGPQRRGPPNPPDDKGRDKRSGDHEYLVGEPHMAALAGACRADPATVNWRSV